MKLNQIFKTGQNSLTFQSIDDLLWVDYLHIMKTQLYVKLDMNYSDKRSYSEKQIEQATSAWRDLEDAIFKLDDSPDSRALIGKSMAKFLLIEKVKLIESDINLLVWYANHEEFFAMGERHAQWETGIQKIYAMIKGHEKKAAIKYFEPVSVNIKILEGVLASLINEYNTKFNDLESKVVKKERSLQYDVHRVNIITGLNLKAKEMVCSEWIEAKKIAKELNKPEPNTTQNGV